MTAMNSFSVEDWRTLLMAVSLINIVAWAVAATVLARQRLGVDVAQARALVLRRTLLWLSAGYVLGCAYRSCWPVYDIPRLVMVDSWMSSAIVGRSVATVAELCFVAQWALLLRWAALASGARFVAGVAALLLPMVAVAELCSWYSVLSTSNLGHVFEESLWGLGAALATAAMFVLRRHHAPRVQRWLLASGLVGCAYVAYMFTQDVPMYWARWRADEAAGRVYLDFAQGLADAARHWTVSTSWQDWGGEVVWMTLYFSLAVWMSIALVHLPLPGGRHEPRGAQDEPDRFHRALRIGAVPAADASRHARQRS